MSDHPDDPATWKTLLAVLLVVVSWPAWGVVRLARWLRFRRIEHLARGWKCTLSGDGIDVQKSPRPAQSVSLQELAEAHWVVHLEREAEGWDFEHLAVRIPSKGLALSDQSGDLQGILKALDQRGVKPRLAKGGRSFTMADGALMLGWMIAGGIAFVVYGLKGR
jgi:hypothetical protein